MMIPDLFGFNKTNEELTLESARKIQGLSVYFDFINQEEEHFLLQHIDQANWLHDLKRRVQHYGYKYDYKSRKIDRSFYIGEIPSWMQFLCARLQERGIINFEPDQAIVNEYINDQGIAPHVDCEPCFGDTIISISLGGTCIVNFQKEINTREPDKIPLFIKPHALLVMQGESRFNWYHGIVGRKSDHFNGQIHQRNRRVSITFRKVLVNE